MLKIVRQFKTLETRTVADPFLPEMQWTIRHAGDAAYQDLVAERRQPARSFFQKLMLKAGIAEHLQGREMTLEQMVEKASSKLQDAEIPDDVIEAMTLGAEPDAVVLLIESIAGLTEINGAGKEQAVDYTPELGQELLKAREPIPNELVILAGEEKPVKLGKKKPPAGSFVAPAGSHLGAVYCRWVAWWAEQIQADRQEIKEGVRGNS